MRIHLITFISLVSTVLLGQSGGDNTYDFLNLPPTAKIASLGGKQISLPDDDINFILSNPALIKQQMSNQLAINYIKYPAGIFYGSVQYGYSHSQKNNFAAGVTYINHGEFPYADESGIRDGNTFTASEYAFNLSYSRVLIDTMLTVGISAKPVFSTFETYNSSGLAFDVGLFYNNPEKLFSAGLVLRNMGLQIDKYYNDHSREKLPFEIQLGITQRLRYAPFRISVLMQHLEAWDLSYETEEQRKEREDPSLGSASEKSAINKFGDNALRHVIIGLDFIPSKSFVVSAGYNYKARKELTLPDAGGMTGFSFGAALNVHRFSIAYAYSIKHISSGSSLISLRLNLNNFHNKM